jgi:hypothetical protein
VSLTKFLELEDRLVSRRMGTIEPTVRLLDLSAKTASVASDWSADVKPKPGKTYILVLAIGATEYYGPNRNGDGFSEPELREHHNTFETNAHVFRSHVNKDPAKSFGKVVKSFYNEDMHRVELVLEIDDAKAPDIADKIREGRTVAVSMGCRIKFDVCSICGNKAPSRKDYCDHAKNQLNEILADGRIVFVDNPDPNFFDISVVWRPADRTGFMMKKVAYDGALAFTRSSASTGEKVAQRELLSKLLGKVADIDKYIEGVGFGAPATAPHTETIARDGHLLSGWVKNIVPKVLASYKPVDNEDLGWLSGKEFPRVLSSLSDMGVLLTTPEFLRLLIKSLTGKDLPDGVVTKLVSAQGALLKMMAEHPELAAAILDTGVLPLEGATPGDSDLEEKTASMARYRGWNTDQLVKLAAISSLPSRSPFEGGNLSTVPVRDQATGKLYYTTGGGVRSAKQQQLMGVGASAVGGAALAAMVYKALGPALKDRGLRALPALLAGGAGFNWARPNSIKVRPDLSVPDTTPFVERTAAHMPIMAISSAADRLSARAYAGPSLQKFSAVLLPEADPVLGCEADFDRTAAKLGQYLLAP